MTRFRVLFSLALASAMLGCGDDKKEQGEPEDGKVPAASTTGAACDGTLSYEDDIRPIFAAYCTRCHAASLTGSARMGAPADHDFDSESTVLAVAAHIDEQAGSGPKQTHMLMPPTSPKPSESDRQKLSRYLACHF